MKDLLPNWSTDFRALKKDDFIFGIGTDLKKNKSYMFKGFVRNINGKTCWLKPSWISKDEKGKLQKELEGDVVKIWYLHELSYKRREQSFNMTKYGTLGRMSRSLLRSMMKLRDDPALRITIECYNLRDKKLTKFTGTVEEMGPTTFALRQKNRTVVNISYSEARNISR